MNKNDLETLKALHIRMSWILLEYNVVYFLKSDFADKFDIHKSWFDLRNIYDHDYDKKWHFFVEFSNVLGFEFNNEVSFDPNRPSAKIILNNMKSEAKTPVLWPNEAEQMYIQYLFLEHFSEKIKSKKVG